MLNWIKRCPCGTEFTTYSPRQRYCSRVCPVRPSRSKNKQQELHTRTCACGTVFEISSGPGRKRISCSDVCSQRIRNKHVVGTKVCELCSVSFDVTSKHDMERRRVCSRECSSEIQSREKAAAWQMNKQKVGHDG